jgi:hypothetical protein
VRRWLEGLGRRCYHREIWLVDYFGCLGINCSGSYDVELDLKWC